MTHRPQLKDQPPKKVVLKPQKSRETSLEDFVVFGNVSDLFRKMKQNFSEQIDILIEKGNDLLDDIKNMAHEESINSKQKFTEKIEILNEQIKTTKEKVEIEINKEIENIHDIFIEEENSFKDLKQKITKQFDEKNSKIQQALDHIPTIKHFIEQFSQSKSEIQQAINHALAIKKGDKGDAPVVGIDFKQPEDGKDAVLTLKKFKELLMQLPEGFFQIKDIKGLQIQLENLAHKAGAAIALGGGQGSHKQVVLSGDIDSSNKIFTYAGEPAAEFSERVFLNYTEQNPLTDYTIVGNTVTYTTAPDASLSGFPHIIRYM